MILTTRPRRCLAGVTWSPHCSDGSKPSDRPILGWQLSNPVRRGPRPVVSEQICPSCATPNSSFAPSCRSCGASLSPRPLPAYESAPRSLGLGRGVGGAEGWPAPKLTPSGLAAQYSSDRWAGVPRAQGPYPDQPEPALRPRSPVVAELPPPPRAGRSPGRPGTSSLCTPSPARPALLPSRRGSRHRPGCWSAAHGTGAGTLGAPRGGRTQPPTELPNRAAAAGGSASSVRPLDLRWSCRARPAP